MGISISFKKKKKIKYEDDEHDREIGVIHNKFEDDINDAVNLVLAMHQDRNSINIELSFACINLPNADMFSLSDPMIVVYIKEKED